MSIFKKPNDKPAEQPVVVTEATFQQANTVISNLVVNLSEQKALKVREAELREELFAIAEPLTTDENQTPFSGVVIPRRRNYTVDYDSALAWATDDKNISGAASMLAVDEAGMMRLIAVIMTTDEETAQKLKDCLSLNATGYVAALREKTHVGMPAAEYEVVRGLSITLKELKVGQALRDTLVVVPDEAKRRSDNELDEEVEAFSRENGSDREALDLLNRFFPSGS